LISFHGLWFLSFAWTTATKRSSNWISLELEKLLIFSGIFAFFMNAPCKFLQFGAFIVENCFDKIGAHSRAPLQKHRHFH